MMNSLNQKGKQFLNILKFRQRKGLLSVFFVVAVVVVVVLLVGPDAHADVTTEIKNGMMNLIGSTFQWLTSKFMALAIFVLRFVIEIASYNNYINSDPVTLGWVLVRDITNMFFVIILMLIAFSTVIGIEAYEWKKLLVKFVMAAILVNFSRVICGIIIDASQVFMMTFISGVAATAGGNLTNMFGLDGMLSMSKNASASAMAEPMNFMVSSMFSCIFAFTAMVVIGAYLIVLLARAVALWILIILSPLAFVLGVIPKFQSYSTMWWTEFTNNVIAGPVLAFFLWLSFAVAGGANIHNEFSTNSPYSIGDVQSQAEAVAAKTGDSGMSLNAIMEWDTMAGFIIACAMLLAGVKVTQKLSAVGVGALGAAAGAAMKFATVATGAAAVRWGAGKAAEGAKAVAKAPIKLAGTRIESMKAGIAAKAYGAADYWNRLIEHRGKTGGREGVGGWFQRRLQIGAAGAKLETRKKELEAQKKRFATSIGEPESLKQKVADIEAEIEVGAGIKAKVQAERKQKGYEKAAQKIIPPNEFFHKGAGRAFTDISYEALAKAEGVNEKMAEEHAISVGKARDKKEDMNVYENSARQAIQKGKMEKLYNPMNYEQLMTHVDKLSKDYATEKDLAKKEDIGKRINMALAAAHSKSGGQAKDASAKVYGAVVKQENAKRAAPIRERLMAADKSLNEEQAGKLALQELAATGRAVSPEVNANELVGQQAHYLSMWLHKFVEKNDTAVKAALDELKERDPANFTAFMAQQTTAMSNAASMGHVNAASLFRLTADGSSYEQSDETRWKGDRRFALADARGKTKGFKNLLDQKYDVNGQVDFVLESEDSIDNVVQLHSGMNKIRASNMQQMDVQTWSEMIEKGSEPAIRKLLDKLYKVVADPQAVATLASRLSNSAQAKLGNLGVLQGGGGAGGGGRRGGGRP